MQKIAIIPISDEGRHLADTLQQEFQALVIRRADVAKRWKDFDAFIFIGAMGICVRTIASLIEDKHTDPPTRQSSASIVWVTMSFRFYRAMWAVPMS